MKNFLVILSFASLINIVEAQMPKVSSGSIQRFEKFNSKFVDTRIVDVWLPEGYSLNKKYAVLYMQDGNALFDSTIMWNHQEWCVDEMVSKLMNENKIKDIIVVGIWNNGTKRHPEYFPQNPFETLTESEQEFITRQLQQKGRITTTFQPISDNYLQFLIQELKPFIDSAFSTKKDRKNTFIAGSSMGALISLYALCEYRDIFGGAACMSTHWPGIFAVENNPFPTAFLLYLKMHLPDPKVHKIYFDYGDQTLDSMYPALQKKVDDVMKMKGFNSKNWETKFFTGENHSETAWAKRLDIPLLFLLNK
jgi:predicted alpha/beta superfamily hydrolase